MLTTFRLLALLSLLNTFCVPAQSFSFRKGITKDRIDFQLVNNLVVIPVMVNGKELSFILDTGSRNTILFSLSDIDTLEVKQVTPIKIRGLGNEGSIDALKSRANTLKIGKTIGVDQIIYIVFDENVNISPKMGIPIHGIIGYEFFKNFVIETNYITKKLRFYDPKSYVAKKCKKCEVIPIQFEKNRPYVTGKILKGKNYQNVKLLLDTGSSDALWLFDQSWGIDIKKKNYFEDFLGYGISGGIYGKKSKILSYQLNRFTFKEVKVSYPDSSAIIQSLLKEGRAGSLGGEIFRRFLVTIDYSRKQIILKKNSYFKDPFYYNMAGITLEHDGMVSVRGFANEEGVHLEKKSRVSVAGAIEIMVNPSFSFFMAPRYVVSEIRANSPADRAGIKKGDVIVSVNGKESYKFKLFELNSLFLNSKEGKRIRLKINRNGIDFTYQFKLEKVL